MECALMSGIFSTLSSINWNNKYLLAASPAIVIGTLSIGSRVAYGIGALGCKSLSAIVDIIDSEVARDMDLAADSLKRRAFRSFSYELKTTAYLTAVTVTGIGLAMIFGIADFKPMIRIDPKQEDVVAVGPMQNQTNTTNYTETPNSSDTPQ